MSRRQNNPLRPLSPEERAELTRLSRAQAEPAAVVARAKAVLAVTGGQPFTDAARTAGRWSGDAVAQLVARFDQAGLVSLAPGRGGGQPKRYTPREQERILREVRLVPNRDEDGTATWSLTTLQRVLRRAPYGLAGISTYTIWWVLHEAGFRWGKDRSWRATGTAVRKSGTVTVTDLAAGRRKLDRGRLPPGPAAGVDGG